MTLERHVTPGAYESANPCVHIPRTHIPPKRVHRTCARIAKVFGVLAFFIVIYGTVTR